MGTELLPPDWADELPEGRTVQVTRYAGPAEAAVQWYAGPSRVRYRVTVGEASLTLDVGQAAVLAAMLTEDAPGRWGHPTDDEGDESDPDFMLPAPGCGHPMPQGADCCIRTS